MQEPGPLRTMVLKSQSTCIPRNVSKQLNLLGDDGTEILRIKGTPILVRQPARPVTQFSAPVVSAPILKAGSLRASEHSLGPGDRHLEAEAD